jgi:hypothetical protein
LELEPEGVADGGLGPIGEPLDGPLAEGAVSLQAEEEILEHTPPPTRDFIGLCHLGGIKGKGEQKKEENAGVYT